MALPAINFAVQDEFGNALSNVEIEVRNEESGLLIPVYADRAGSSSLGNPFLWASGAHVLFYVPSGAYKITARKDTILVSDPWRHVAFGTAAETDASDLNVETTVTAAGDFTVTDQNLVRLNKTVPATTNVILPASATRPGEDVTIKDVAGNAGTFNFAIKAASGENVDGITAAAGGYLGTMNFQTVRLRGRADGTGWDVIHSG